MSLAPDENRRSQEEEKARFEARAAIVDDIARRRTRTIVLISLVGGLALPILYFAPIAGIVVLLLIALISALLKRRDEMKADR